MNAQQLSNAIKLSVEASLKSGHTDVAQAVGILHAHANALSAVIVRPAPAQPFLKGTGRNVEIIDPPANGE